MKLAIMQPYWFPYLGYFQLIRCADVFVIYDNIKYTKRGWINRNRILENGTAGLISLPLKKAPDSADIRERQIAEQFDRRHLVRRLSNAYRRAPQFPAAMELLESLVQYPDDNLFAFLRNSIVGICRYLGIPTMIVTASSIDADHALCGQDRVLDLCRALGASTYVNPVGGVGLYDAEAFAAKGVELRFLRSPAISYPQFSAPFVPMLSIIDVMMFNTMEAIAAWTSGAAAMTLDGAPTPA
jgi:hypothetical protein